MAASRRPAVRIPSRGLVAAAGAQRARDEAAKAKKRAEREAVAVDAPPLSSSDDEEEEPPEDISDSSAAEKDRRRSLRSQNRRKPRLIIASGRHKDNDAGSGSDGSQRGTKRPLPREEPVMAQSLFNRTARSSLQVSYGRKSATAQRSASASTTPSRPSQSSESSQPPQPLLPVFKRYDDDLTDLSEPEENENFKAQKRQASSPPRPAARFIKPPSMTAEDLAEEERDKTPPKKFQHSKWKDSGDEEESEELKKISSKKFQHSKYANSDDEGDQPRPTNTNGKAMITTKVKAGTKPSNLSDGEDVKKKVKEMMSARQPWKKKKLLAKENKQPLFGELDVEPASPPVPRAVFKMPEYESFTGNAGEKDVMDVDNDSSSIILFDDEKDNASDDTLANKGPAVCPLCKAPLEESVLRDLLDGHHLLVGIAVGRSHVIQLNLLKFDEKLRFCTGHKQRASRLAWTARGYPAIDWAALPARLTRYESHVKKVIMGTTQSPFRTAWEKMTPSQLSSQSEVPGYYGRRGLRVLSDAIVQRHAKTLRRRAVEDPLVAARGMVQFVQAVLVPELAVQLIREDMLAGGGGGGLDEARRVLHESAAIGEEVMEEERDVIEDDDDEDGEDEDVSF
ncbi:hypothetical protein SEUCBS139899_003765 [Sporothrix eucalyptigena]|uniref:Restriction of telomere capping protein 4 n=1 Tax=Sporothrix eucalyptigena TaxID=1812306 RepID=A0ABP0BF07_9PEZI